MLPWMLPLYALGPHCAGDACYDEVQLRWRAQWETLQSPANVNR